MIKGINAGPHLTVMNTYTSHPSFGTGILSAGMVRYNGSLQTLEVYDGTSWQQYGGAFPTIELTPAARSTLEWAMKKQLEDTHIEELCSKYPGLGKARDNFELFKAFVATEESKL